MTCDQDREVKFQKNLAGHWLENKKMASCTRRYILSYCMLLPRCVWYCLMLHGREGHCVVLTCIDFDTIEVILRDWRDFDDGKFSTKKSESWS